MPIVGIDVQRVDPLRNEVADVLMQKFQQTDAGTKQQDAFEQFQEADQPDPAVFSHCQPRYQMTDWTRSTCRAQIN